MRRTLSLTLVLSLFSLALSALVGQNQYSQGYPYSGNSLHRGGYGHQNSNGHQNLRGAGHYGGPSSYQQQARAPLNPYQPSAPRSPYSSYGAPAAPHFGSQSYSAGPSNAYKRNSYQPPQTHANYQQDPKSQTQGREMKYTIRDPHNKGTTHVTETHVVSNRQMHGAEAEAAMKKLMGSMGPGPSYDNGFQDFVKDMGLPFY